MFAIAALQAIEVRQQRQLTASATELVMCFSRNLDVYLGTKSQSEPFPLNNGLREGLGHSRRISLVEVGGNHATKAQEKPRRYQHASQNVVLVLCPHWLQWACWKEYGHVSACF
eukprot:2723405-Rhodomonas_salina.2